MFSFVAAIAVSCLGFFFPSTFFLGAEKYYPNPKLMAKNRYQRVCAYIHFVLGVIVFLLCFSMAIYGIIQESKHKD